MTKLANTETTAPAILLVCAHFIWGYMRK